MHYRSKLNFTFDGLKAAATAVERLRNYKQRLETDRFPAGTSDSWLEKTRAAEARFDAGLDDDLNTAEALASVFEYVRESNTAMDAGDFRAGNTGAALALLDRFDSVFDVLRPTAATGGLAEAEIVALIAERSQARTTRNFARADQIRAELLEKGVILEDTKDGVRWRRKQA